MRQSGRASRVDGIRQQYGTPVRLMPNDVRGEHIRPEAVGVRELAPSARADLSTATVDLDMAGLNVVNAAAVVFDDAAGPKVFHSATAPVTDDVVGTVCLCDNGYLYLKKTAGVGGWKLLRTV